MIQRTNQMFIRLAEIGECNEKGKTVLGYQFKGKLIGAVDRHLCTIVGPFLEEVLSMAHWSSTEARDADLAQFTAYVATLQERAARPEPATPGPLPESLEPTS